MSAIIPKTELKPVIKTPQELVHIKHKITLRQYKYWVLMLRAYREAYEAGIGTDDQGYHLISIADVTRWLGYEPVRSELRADFEAIRKEPIIYNVLGKDGKTAQRGAGFISEWEISSNWIGFRLPTFLQDCIKRLDLKSSIFQALNWSIFNSFNGKYEAIIYKLCKDYMGVSRTPYMSLEVFREYMGVKEIEYTDFKRLNQWVISGPVKRINESEISDITIATELKRESRRVVGLWFHVSPKMQTVMDFGDDVAFRFAKVDIPIPQQKKYLESKSPELVELSIQRANIYADEQEKTGKEVNLGALYRKAIEEDWGKDYESKLARENEKAQAEKERKSAETHKALEEKREALKNDFIRETTSEALKALTTDERKALVERYIREAGPEKIGSYDQETLDFKNAVERMQFSVWLRSTVSPKFEPESFHAWLVGKGIDVKKLEM